MRTVLSDASSVVAMPSRTAALAGKSATSSFCVCTWRLQSDSVSGEAWTQAAYYWFMAAENQDFPRITVIPALIGDVAYCARGPAIHLIIAMAGNTQMMPLSRK